MRIFLMPIEIASRELKYKVRLAESIKKEGDIIIIGKIWLVQRLARIFRFMNWIGQNCFEKSRIDGKTTAESLRQNGGKLFYIDEEGGVYPDDMAESIFKSRYSRKCFTDDDIILSWGQKQKEILNDMGITNYAVGHPRFVIENTEHPIESNANILIMTNFSLVFSERSFRENYFDKSVFESRLSEATLNISKLFKFVAEQDGKTVINIRVHPSEDDQVYRLMFRHFKNVHILRREDLDVSLLRSGRVYHFNCTTALDSFARGISTTNLADGNVSIIKDIPSSSHSIQSQWLIFPCDYHNIERLINNNARPYEKNVLNICFIYAALFLFSILHHLRSLLIFSKYEKGKLGSVATKSFLWKILGFTVIRCKSSFHK
jgi:surface carbohydrate biosynthesis protein